MSDRTELARTIAESFGWDWDATPEEHIPSAVECCEDPADAIISAGWVRVTLDSALGRGAVGTWCVYQADAGIAWACDPPTEETARRAAEVHGTGYDAVPVVLAAHLSNAFAHGRMHGHRQAAALRGEA